VSAVGAFEGSQSHPFGFWFFFVAFYAFIYGFRHFSSIIGKGVFANFRGEYYFRG